MALADQLIPLLGVVVGAGTSYVVTILQDGRKHLREIALRDEERKIEAYTRYAASVKHMVGMARRVASTRDLDDPMPGVEEAAALRSLDEAENARSLAAESLGLFASAEVIKAVQQLNKRVWRLESLVVGHIPADKAIWREAIVAYRVELEGFRLAARKDLNRPDHGLRTGANYLTREELIKLPATRTVSETPAQPTPPVH
ncbi:hypothetical protein GCM10009555_039860 [Acrocarpospora macrocephala]|uniref:Secreted protein n=1 Tax=Acrocarpospora macrocephala TaxID=150177 RepID=A0A5M3WND5_9ACTN|nr:hypothetical protein [Acrocarpospora macrocephala]GES10040.1 hypothetical protein Amac_036370 [Acrocarpospora macrocephala]